MIDAPLALALTAGVVAAINPCAFSLLPAYIGYFVLGDAAAMPLHRRLTNAAGSAVGVTIGFVVVFITLGVILDSFVDRFSRHLPWLTIAVGAVLVATGIVALTGRGVRITLPLIRLARRRGAVGTVTYGSIYALASLSCSLGPFLTITAFAVDRSAAAGIATYAAYAVGMGVVILIIAAATALVRPGPVRHLRRLSQFAVPMGGAMMILGGAYAIWYGRWQLSVYAGDFGDDRVIRAGENLRVDLIGRVEQIGAVRLTVAVVAIVVVAIVGGRFRQRLRRRTTAG